MSPQIKISRPNPEQMLQVSKSRKIPLLVDTEEMENLFSNLGEFEIFDVSRPVKEEEMCISKQTFIDEYHRYVLGIQNGELIEENGIRPFFSAIFTNTREILYAIPLSNDRYLIKASSPVIQLQRHHFIFTDTFHSGVIGEESITWGIQFSYPQLYLDPKTKAIGKVEKNQKFPNTELFQKLGKWARNFTRPTPFIIGEKQKNHPIRLGKNAFRWINNHPSLKKKDLYVANPKNPQLSH